MKRLLPVFCAAALLSVLSTTSAAQITMRTTPLLRKLPNFSYQTLEGKHSSLRALRGKVVVLSFWFTTCEGCELEHESLNKLATAFADDSDVVLLAIALEPPALLRKYLDKHPLHWQIVPNGMKLCERLGVEGFPTHVVIDKDGSTAALDIGGAENEHEILERCIRKER